MCQTAAIASQAFVDWDVFNHQKALNNLLVIVGKNGQALAPYISRLRSMVDNGPTRVPERILDVWLNAQRCARRGVSARCTTSLQKHRGSRKVLAPIQSE